MILIFDILMRWFDVVAQLTALSIMLGPMKRYFPSRGLTRIVLGAACGGFASMEMLQPLMPAPGIILDLRMLPVAIAGSFLGWGGAAAAAIVSMATRASIGGAGAFAGIAGLLTVTCAGVLWARFYGLEGKHPIRHLLLLGAIPSLGLPYFLIIPGDVGWALLKATFPIYVPLNMAGMIFVGWVIDRERFLLRRYMKLEVESRTDHLTGLLNRRGMEEELAQLLPKAGVAEFLLVDCDRFKSINDQYGHAAGDLVLFAIGGMIAREAGRDAIVARFGGDEFAVALLSSAHPSVTDFAARLRRVVCSTPITLPGGEVIVASISIGVAPWGLGDAFHNLLLRADQALYGAKRSGRRPSQRPVAVPAAARPTVAAQPALAASSAEKIHGSCLCGDLQLVAQGGPLRIGFCDCPSCRKHHGAQFHTTAIFAAESVSLTGPRQSHEGRFFCPRCGTLIFSQTGAEIEVHLSNLNAPHPAREAREAAPARPEGRGAAAKIRRFARDRADPATD